MSCLFKADYRPGKDGYRQYIYRMEGIPRGNWDLFRFISIRPGLEASIFTQVKHEISEVLFEIGEAPVSFSFFLYGGCIHSFDAISSQPPREFSLGPGSNIIASLPHSRGRITMDPELAMGALDIKIDRRLLASYLTGSPKSQFLNRLLDPRVHTYQSLPMTPAMLAATQALIHPPRELSGPALSLFQEGQVLSLLSFQIQRLLEVEGTHAAPTERPDDAEKLHTARRILESNFKDAPTIATLARRCGLNEFHLKKGFKTLFGTTVHGYLQLKKMETAWQLLDQEGYSVSQAAFTVGYTNVSHFSAAFRKHFHFNPSHLKKNRPHPPNSSYTQHIGMGESPPAV